jgi:L-lactate dehydrogenase
VIAHLAHAVLADERSVQPLSVAIDGEYDLRDVSLSIPCVIGQHGVAARLTPGLSRDEIGALHASAEVLREAERSAAITG